METAYAWFDVMRLYMVDISACFKSMHSEILLFKVLIKMCAELGSLQLHIFLMLLRPISLVLLL